MFSGVIGALRVNLGMNSAAFNKGATEAERRMAGVQKNFKRVGRRMERVGKSMSVALSAPLVALAYKSTEAAGQQQKAIASVEAVLRSMGDTAGYTSGELQGMAANLQENSLYGDEDILNRVTANLLTFGQVQGEVFARAQQVALDLSARLGQDLQSSAVMLGKALNDPAAGLTALSRVGVSFTEQQKEQVKAMAAVGDVAGAQALMLSELERQYAGQAQALALTDAGQITQSMNAIGDAFEVVGAIILPIVADVATSIKGMAEKFQELDPALQRFIVAGAAIAAVVGPLVLALGVMVSAFGALLPAISAVGAALAVLSGPIGWAIGAVALLGAGIYAMRDDSEDAANATVALTSALGDEITQSQLLSAELGTNGSMSVQAAKAKRQEAISRYENVKAIHAERAALRNAGNDAFAGLSKRISDAQEMLGTLGNPYTETAPAHKQAAFDEQQMFIVDLLNERQEILNADKALDDQLALTSENIERLDAALDGASGGVVTFGDALIVPIKPTEVLIETLDRNAGSAVGAARSVGVLNDTLEDVPSLADQIGEAFERMFERLKAGNVGAAFSGLFDDIKAQGAASFSELVDTAFSEGGFDLSKIGKGLASSFSDGFKSLGKAFSGGGLSSVFGGISSAVASFLPVVGAISTITNLIKGFSSKKTIGAGLELGFSGGDVIGGQFETIKRSSFWGLFSNTRTNLTDFDAELADALGDQLDRIQGAVRDAYDVAGVAVSDAMIDGVNLAVERIDTRGLSEAEIQERVESVFAQYGDALSEAIGGVGYDLMVNFANIKPMLEAAGQMFYGTLEGMAGAAQELSDVFGGSDALGSAVGGFVDRFFSDQERLDILSDQINDTFEDLGLAVPATNDAFRDLVLSQDLMTEAGREAYAALMGVAPVFDDVTNSVERLGEAFGDGNDAFQSDYEARLAKIADVRGYSVSQSVYFDGGSQINGRLGELVAATRDQISLTREMLSVWERGEVYGN